MADPASATTGVLLANLGTPDDPSPPAVRRFLKEMLSDRRIVDLPKLLWWPILHGIILRTRPARSAEAYQKIWMPEGSPQMVYGRRLIERMRALGLLVAMGMTYRKPSIAAGMNALREAGATRLVVLPIFPQYSGATTGPVFDQVRAELKRSRWNPQLRLIENYHDATDYIEALRGSVVEHWDHHGRPGHLVMSFHGLPKKNCDRGDPYRMQCEATAQLLAQALKLRDGEWTLTFQSRFGAQEWLQPYTEPTLMELAGRGIKRIGVVCPGFAVDCLETLEEIALRGAEVFREHGGESLDYIPALNDRPDHAAFLVSLARQN